MPTFPNTACDLAYFHNTPTIILALYYFFYGEYFTAPGWRARILSFGKDILILFNSYYPPTSVHPPPSAYLIVVDCKLNICLKVFKEQTAAVVYKQHFS